MSPRGEAAFARLREGQARAYARRATLRARANARAAERRRIARIIEELPVPKAAREVVRAILAAIRPRLGDGRVRT